ncbi:hypothetical protein [Streptomyces sp. NRRL WC-3742]|uniref:hypothetical protein n=1 Tax=Streptomyces sp. NRRL WC-3742 TaxID=1463934 RepID=UPI00131EB930|nr:hypothetical protein [Streptomyces sp. NRRL WC-3742]
MDRQLYVRWTLTAVNNGKIHLSEPKTEASRAWISLSPRVMTALHRQAALQMDAHPDGRLEDLVLRSCLRTHCGRRGSPSGTAGVWFGSMVARPLPVQVLLSRIAW